MRVCFVTSAGAAWGAERSLAIIADELSAMGHSVTIMCSSGTVAGYFRAAGVDEVVEVDHKDAHFSRLMSFCGRLMRNEHGFDAVVLFSTNLYPLTWLLRFRFSWKVFMDIHDSFDDVYSRAKILFSALAAHRSVVISEYVARQLPEWIDKAMVPRPIPRAASAPVLNKDVVTVGIVGRIVPEKRIDLAIGAISHLSELQLYVYGGGSEEYESRLTSLASTVAAGRVVFRGMQPQEIIYREIDLLLVCNPREASGRTVGEAMSRAIPVLVPSQGGAREFISSEGTGFIWDATQLEAGVVDGLRRVVADLDRAHAVGRAGWAAITDRSPRAVATKYASIIGPKT